MGLGGSGDYGERRERGVGNGEMEIQQEILITGDDIYAGVPQIPNNRLIAKCIGTAADVEVSCWFCM